MKGQVAFETLFIFIIIMTSAIFITSLFIQTNEAIVSESLARNAITEQAALQGKKIIIESVSFEKTTNTKITITVMCEEIQETIFDPEKIEEMIEEKTSFRNIEIVINKKQL